MKTETLYFTKDWKKAGEGSAAWIVIRTLDADGRLVKESIGTARVKDKKPAGKTGKEKETKDNG